MMANGLGANERADAGYGATGSASIGWNVLQDFVTDVFVGYGVPPEDARICADVVLESDKRGIESHGVNRLKPFYVNRLINGTQLPVTDFEIVREQPTTAVVDGHNGMGQVVAYRAMKLAIGKARTYGTAMVAVRHSNHFGIAGYYAMMAADEGCIGIVGTNARPSVAPTFGVANMLGTNPLAIAMPSDEDSPFVFDGATSIIQRGKIEYYRREGRVVPSGTVIDRQGRPLTDPEAILSGFAAGQAALVPLGGTGEATAGYKGYGYATVVELLSCALQQGSYLTMLTNINDGVKQPMGIGHFFIAVDVSAFTPLESFSKTVGDVLRQLRGSRKAPGCERIYTAGEKEHLRKVRSKNSGLVLQASIRKEFLEICEDLGLRRYVTYFAS